MTAQDRAVTSSNGIFSHSSTSNLQPEHAKPVESFASVLARSGTRGLLNQIGFEVGSTTQERAYYRGALTEIRDEFVDSGANSRRAQHEPRRWRKIRQCV